MILKMNEGHTIFNSLSVIFSAEQFDLSVCLSYWKQSFSKYEGSLVGGMVERARTRQLLRLGGMTHKAAAEAQLLHFQNEGNNKQTKSAMGDFVTDRKDEGKGYYINQKLY